MAMLLRSASALLLFWMAAAPLAAGDQNFHWKNDEPQGVADLFYGQQPVVRYMRM